MAVWTEAEPPDEIRFLKSDGTAMLYQELLSATHPGARMLQVTSLPKGTYALKIDGKLLSTTWSNADLGVGIDLQMQDTPSHKSAVALYYACSDAELNQTERSRQLGTLKAYGAPLSASAETFFGLAMERSREKVRAASALVERQIELLPAPKSLH